MDVDPEDQPIPTLEQLVESPHLWRSVYERMLSAMMQQSKDNDDPIKRIFLQNALETLSGMQLEEHQASLQEEEQDWIQEPRFLPYDHETRLADAGDEDQKTTLQFQNDFMEDIVQFGPMETAPVSHNWSYLYGFDAPPSLLDPKSTVGTSTGIGNNNIPLSPIASDHPTNPKPKTLAEKKAIILEKLAKPTSAADFDFKSKVYSKVLEKKAKQHGVGITGSGKIVFLPKPSGPGPSTKSSLIM